MLAIELPRIPCRRVFILLVFFVIIILVMVIWVVQYVDEGPILLGNET